MVTKRKEKASPAKDQVSSGGVGRLRRVLYFAPDIDAYFDFVRDLSVVDGASQAGDARDFCLKYKEIELCWATAATPFSALDTLSSIYVNILVIDLRWPSENERESWVASGLALLEALDNTADLEARYGFHRIIVLLPDAEPELIDPLVIEIGARGVGHVLRCSGGADLDFATKVLDEIVGLIKSRRLGSRVLCASGGGITGIYFELGAIKCLDDCFSDNALNTFDSFYGISAGAVITTLLAIGYSPDELMAAIADHPGGRIPFLDLKLMSFSNLNASDIQRRFRAAGLSGFKVFRDILRGKSHVKLDSLIFEYGDLFGAPFSSARFEKELRKILELPGATNDFRDLPRPLYVGTSDQDTRKHVLFGAKGTDHIEISRAVQASISVNPAFGSVPIAGRYYEDGAVTRTSNFGEAIRQGASLVIVLDPFVPYVSKQAGYSSQRGVLYNVDQNLRTISYTRFEQARNWTLRKHPDVSSYTFLPSNRLRRILSINPMDHRLYLPIWRGAYLSTLKRLKHLSARMRGDLIVHGVQLDTSRAEEVAKRLRRITNPTLADFYPDRKIVIKKPPLVNE